MKNKVFTISSLFYILSLSSFNSLRIDYDNVRCNQLYNYAIAQVQNDHNRSLSTLYEICNNCNDLSLKNKSYLKAHAINDALTFQNQCQLYGQRTNTIENLKNYLIWLTHNSNEDIALLQSDANIRVHVKKIIDLVEVRGLRPSSCAYEKLTYIQVHEIYIDIPEKYFGPSTIRAWMSVLMRCNDNGDWRATMNFKDWYAAATQNSHVPCSAKWIEFLDKLDRWILSNPANLNTQAIAPFISQQQRLHELLD
jgi:hypothetical protein